MRTINALLMNHKNAANFVSTLFYTIHVALSRMLLK